jgi:hypothetical protein
VAAAVCAALSLAACAPAGGSASLSAADRQQLREILTASLHHATDAEAAAYRRAQDDAVRDCMGRAGFAYVPPAPPDTPKVTLHLSDDEFARKYGFGISTLIDYHRPGAPSRTGSTTTPAVTDPKKRQRTLDGCLHSATAALGQPPLSGAGELSTSRAVGDRLRAIETAAERDGRVAAAREQYQACMSPRGYSAASPEALTNVFRGRAERYVTLFRKHGGDGTLVELLGPADRAALAALQSQERAAAIVDRSCSPALYTTTDLVHREYEQRALADLTDAQPSSGSP